MPSGVALALQMRGTATLSMWSCAAGQKMTIQGEEKTLSGGEHPGALAECRATAVRHRR